jgi:hypothetical protein
VPGLFEARSQIVLRRFWHKADSEMHDRQL